MIDEHDHNPLHIEVLFLEERLISNHVEHVKEAIHSTE
jgi:hypothetical protein